MAQHHKVETINIQCADCGKPLQVVWCNGVVSDQYSVLIADWLFCSECYDDMTKEMEKCEP